MTWRFSRTRDSAFVRCPYYYWLRYHYRGQGVVRKGLNLGTSTGSMTHEMLAFVMSGLMNNAPDMQGMLDEGVALARANYLKVIEEKGFLDVAQGVEYEIQRQAALSEGLVRAWCKSRLCEFHRTYKVLSVEKKDLIEIAPGYELMSILDVVSERRADQEVFAGPEFKTTGYMSDSYLEGFRYDTQTASHVLDVEKTFGKRPAGVLMEFLYKGVKRRNEVGEDIYYSPLVRGYKMEDPITGELEFGYDSGLARKKGWKAFDTWTLPGGMKEWVDTLPEDVLESHLFATVIYRSDKEVEGWRRKVLLRQQDIEAGVIALEAAQNEDEREHLMDSFFPARMDLECYDDKYHKKCTYLDHCYGTIGDLLESGEFELRDTEHEEGFEV